MRRLDGETMDAARPQLCELLIDSVRQGASVGFLDPLSVDEADAYWRRIQASVERGRCVLLLTDDGSGTVQLDVDTLPNQPHRATVSKLLVHSGARRRGIGTALMEELERVAAGAGRWLLTLDTATDDAARLYERLGYARAGEIPEYALNPDGSPAATVFYFKRLSSAPAAATGAG
jgi:ribosomal protein S18 acetylase RimI-like enzyme